MPQRVLAQGRAEQRKVDERRGFRLALAGRGAGTLLRRNRQFGS